MYMTESHDTQVHHAKQVYHSVGVGFEEVKSVWAKLSTKAL